MDDILQEISNLRQKAQAYDTQKDTRSEIANKLRELSQNMQDIAQMLDPKFDLQVGRRKRADHGDKIDELFDKLKSGTQVTMALIQGSYQDLQFHQAYHILKVLQKMPGVHTAKDGQKVRLFYQ